MKTKFVKIKYPTPRANTEYVCPECGGPLNLGSIPCPDGIEGCGVNHLGYTCLSCGERFYKAVITRESD